LPGSQLAKLGGQAGFIGQPHARIGLGQGGNGHGFLNGQGNGLRIKNGGTGRTLAEFLTRAVFQEHGDRQGAVVVVLNRVNLPASRTDRQASAFGIACFCLKGAAALYCFQHICNNALGHFNFILHFLIQTNCLIHV